MKRTLLSATIVFTSLSVCLGVPPNILFFFTDDQRHDTLGCAGHPIVETPTIDRLAAQGARFTNMFVTRSTCWASHATTLTGLTSRSSVKGDGSDQIKPEALTELFQIYCEKRVIARDSSGSGTARCRRISSRKSISMNTSGSFADPISRLCRTGRNGTRRN